MHVAIERRESPCPRLPPRTGRRAVRDGGAATQQDRGAARGASALRPDVVRRTKASPLLRRRLAASGGADGRLVPDYAAASGVDPDRGTDTFAEVVLDIDTPRWEGTRFVLRAGKALTERRKGVRVHFRPVPGAPGNDLWIGIDGPDDVVLSLTGFSPDEASPTAPMTLAGPQPTGDLSPYAMVLLNLLQGESNLSVGAEEAEQAWRILDPVRRPGTRSGPLGRVPRWLGVDPPATEPRSASLKGRPPYVSPTSYVPGASVGPCEGSTKVTKSEDRDQSA